MAESLLTTAQVAEQTGIAPGTLRVWKVRYGFPRPTNTVGGQDRYTEEEVAALREVAYQRSLGVSLTAAIARVREQPPVPAPPSIFAAVRQARPDLAVHRWTKRALISLSRAIEDELSARAERAVLIGSFQREQHFRASDTRWQALAEGRRTVVALAEFERLHEREDGVIEVPVEPGHLLGREWAVVVHGPGMSACLTAWELPARGFPPERSRRFETIFSVEPDAAYAASQAALRVIEERAPAVAAKVAPQLNAPPAVPGGLRSADQLTARALAYVAAA